MILNADALNIPLADQSVHCVVTSPPYWGLRDYGIDGQLGLESTPEEYVAHMVAVFREVWRVLRDDGTLWLNLGDSYAANRAYQVPDNKRGDVGNNHGMNVPPGIKPKDLCGIPWRVAFALQADGWYLRSDIIWSKPNPMPESVTDRPTKAHEYLFLLAKRERYYYDAEAVKEESSGLTGGRFGTGGIEVGRLRHDSGRERPADNGTRNRRTVWTIATAPYSGAHFATYPPALVEPCIKAGTSQRGVCPVCGKPWERVVEKERHATRPGNYSSTDFTAEHFIDKGSGGNTELRYRYETQVTTTGWRPACGHDAEPVPAVVLDPFNGSGTTGLVAQQLGRRYVGLDLSFPYLRLAKERLGMTALEEWTNGIQAGPDGWHDLPLFQEANG